jgi:hypothetical protein
VIVEALETLTVQRFTGPARVTEVSMTDLQELYQSVILDHNRKPRNFGELAGREPGGGRQESAVRRRGARGAGGSTATRSPT